MAVSLKFPIYMDYHASTPVDPRALEAMLPYLSVHFGNAASQTHPFGWKADDAVEAARRQVAALIGASAKEIVFTSGATESNNLAIKGVAHAFSLARQPHRHADDRAQGRPRQLSAPAEGRLRGHVSRRRP